MASFVAMEREGAVNRPDTVLVRDEFSILALIFPFFWLLWHRLWFAALMVLLLSVGLAMGGEIYPAGAAIGAVNLLIGLLVALEGPAWRIARFRRMGYRDAGAVRADTMNEAEIRWFARATRQPILGRAAMPPLPGSVPAGSGGSDLLFGFDGKSG